MCSLASYEFQTTDLISQKITCVAYKISLKCLHFELYISSSDRKSQDLILHSSDCGMVGFASVCYDTMLLIAKSIQFQ